MTHGDDRGLKLPPNIAPIQVIVIPVATHKEGVTEKASALKTELEKVCRVGIDLTDRSPGWKFAEYEMKGIPLRLEIGPKDIENNQCCLVRRDTNEKIFVDLTDVSASIMSLLTEIQNNMHKTAKNHRDGMIQTATDMNGMKNKKGFIKAMWCGSAVCEAELKEQTGVTSRCIPFEKETLSDVCVCCSKPAETLVYWGRAY